MPVRHALVLANYGAARTSGRFDALALFGPLLPRYGGGSLLSGAPRCCYPRDMVGSAGPRMATGDASITATSAHSLSVSLPSLFCVASILCPTPHWWFSANDRRGSAFRCRRPRVASFASEYRLATECVNRVKSNPTIVNKL